MTNKQIEDELLSDSGLIPTALRTIGRIMQTTAESIEEQGELSESIRWFKRGVVLHETAEMIEAVLPGGERYPR